MNISHSSDKLGQTILAYGSAECTTNQRSQVGDAQAFTTGKGKGVSLLGRLHVDRPQSSYLPGTHWPEPAGRPHPLTSCLYLSFATYELPTGRSLETVTRREKERQFTRGQESKPVGARQAAPGALPMARVRVPSVWLDMPHCSVPRPSPGAFHPSLTTIWRCCGEAGRWPGAGTG